MKASLTALLGVLIALPTLAQAAQTHCFAKEAPVTVEIEWGAVTRNAGDLPPYAVNEEQAASVTVTNGDETTAYETSFHLAGGATRCEWWRTSKGPLGDAGGLSLHVVPFQSCGFDRELNVLSLGDASVELSCSTASDSAGKNQD